MSQVFLNSFSQISLSLSFPEFLKEVSFEELSSLSLCLNIGAFIVLLLTSIHFFQWRWRNIGSNFGSSQENSISKPLYLSLFDGKKPLRWVLKVEQLFSYFNTSEKHRLVIATYYLDGEALSLKDNSGSRVGFLKDMIFELEFIDRKINDQLEIDSINSFISSTPITYSTPILQIGDSAVGLKEVRGFKEHGMVAVNSWMAVWTWVYQAFVTDIEKIAVEMRTANWFLLKDNTNYDINNGLDDAIPGGIKNCIDAIQQESREILLTKSTLNKVRGTVKIKITSIYATKEVNQSRARTSPDAEINYGWGNSWSGPWINNCLQGLVAKHYASAIYAPVWYQLLDEEAAIVPVTRTFLVEDEEYRNKVEARKSRQQRTKVKDVPYRGKLEERELAAPVSDPNKNIVRVEEDDRDPNPKGELGISETKQDFQEIVKTWKTPNLFSAIWTKFSKGVLVGPPTILPKHSFNQRAAFTVSFANYTRYVTVNEDCGRQKFYGFVRFGDDNVRSRALSEMNSMYSKRPMCISVAPHKKFTSK